MRRLLMVSVVLVVAGCGASPAAPARVRPVGAPAARAADASAIAKGAMADYGKHLAEVLKALGAKDARGLTAAIEKLFKALADALRAVAKATGDADAPASKALADFEVLKARYDSLEGDLTLDGSSAKDALARDIQATLTRALTEAALAP